MIQIIGLRSYTDKSGKQRTTHKHFSNAASIPELFNNIDQFIETLPPEERYNLYYTALDCVDPSKVGGALRKFKSQDIIPFDIDNIDLDKLPEYIDLFFKTTGLDDAKCAIVATGNGLQILTQIEEPFTDENYFEQKRDHYKETCAALDKAFKAAGLPGDADPAVWSGARLLRLPNTENRKPKKGVKQAKLLFTGLMPQEFTWIEPCVPSNSQKEFLEGTHKNSKDDKARSAASFGTVDHKEIFQKCDFMKWTQSKPEEVREPAFYAALSILSRMEKGEDKCRALFDKIKASGSDSSVAAYGEGEYQDKYKAAVENAKPRTCKNIDSVMGWAGKCKTCKKYGAVKSPISLKSPEHIATKDKGFCRWSENGKPIPQYEDLLKFFDQKYHHKTIRTAGLVNVWENNHYRVFHKPELLNFARVHFKPLQPSKVRHEFRELVCCDQLKDPKFFSEQLNGLLNCANGILDLKTREILPHTPEKGFRYVLPYSYSEEGDCPMFKKFLQEVCCEDQDLVNLLQEFMGYIVSGDEYWKHKCLMLTGTGNNGKGVFLRILKALVGAENYAAVMYKDLKCDNKKQLLEGMLFNISEEVGPKELNDANLFKAMTGDCDMTVKLMWNQPYRIKNRCKMVFSCNELPGSNDASGGFLRRFCIVPFNRVFVEGQDEDPFLFQKLEAELPQILKFALDGYDRLHKNKEFTKAKASNEELSNYASTNNIVKYWLEETGDYKISELNGKCTFEPTETMYSDFMDWGIGKGRTADIDIRTFGTKLTQALPSGKERSGRPMVNGRRQRGFYDVARCKKK